MHTRILPRLIPRPAFVLLSSSPRPGIQPWLAAMCRVKGTTFVLRCRSIPITNLAVKRRLAHIRPSVASERGQ